MIAPGNSARLGWFIVLRLGSVVALGIGGGTSPVLVGVIGVSADVVVHCLLRALVGAGLPWSVVATVSSCMWPVVSSCRTMCHTVVATTSALQRCFTTVLGSSSALCIRRHVVKLALCCRLRLGIARFCWDAKAVFSYSRSAAIWATCGAMQSMHSCTPSVVCAVAALLLVAAEVCRCRAASVARWHRSFVTGADNSVVVSGLQMASSPHKSQWVAPLTVPWGQKPAYLAAEVVICLSSALRRVFIIC